MIQNINREMPFYPDPIYRPPPKPKENLQLPIIESKTDASPRVDLEFKENSLYQEGIITETTYNEKPTPDTKGHMNHTSKNQEN